MAQRKFTNDQARERKNARQAEYNKRTGYVSQKRYHENNVKNYTLSIILSTEGDIYDKLESVDNKSGYIKSLIRADIAKQYAEDE